MTIHDPKPTCWARALRMDVPGFVSDWNWRTLQRTGGLCSWRMLFNIVQRELTIGFDML